MAITIIFETHSISQDNERGVASGWADGPLSGQGRVLAHDLGDRRRDDGIAAVFSSDLRRARETVEIAFSGRSTPVFLDWRLRECDYGDLNGGPADVHLPRRGEYVDQPYPRGESWRQATARVAGALRDLFPRWDGTRLLLVGHVATRWALEQCANGADLSALATEDFKWQAGWEYHLTAV